MIEWIDSHILSLIIFMPLLSSGMVLVPSDKYKAQWLAMGGALITFLLSARVWGIFDSSTATLQLVEAYHWIPDLGIRYIVGVDGLNLLLLVLTTFLTPLVLVSVWNWQQKYYKSFLSLLLLLEAGMIGALLAFDMVFFYIFWEVMLIPMYFIIGIWGGANKIYATTKFVIYTVFGSLIMLVAAISIYILHFEEAGFYSTSLLDLYYISNMGANTQALLFAAFALAFAIKVPIFPFHTWLPHAHTEAPTGGSVLLAGVLLKMGTYGFIRFAIPLFPEALLLFSPYLLGLGVIGIIYGALMAWMQRDAKRLVAYSSVSHLGFVVIGSVAILNNRLSEEALTGALYQMINHGISTGALFFLVGMLYERRHTRMLADFGGLAKVMPWFSVCLIVATLGSIGLPGTGGFVGEFLILIGVFKVNSAAAILASTGVVLGAVYMLSLCLDVLFGPVTNPENSKLRDIGATEKLYIFPLSALIVVMGLFPNYFLAKSRESIRHLSHHLMDYRLTVRASQASKDTALLATSRSRQHGDLP